MSRFAPTLRFAVTEDGSTIRKIDWAEIEVAFGHPLSRATKKRIRQATTSFVLFEPFERNAQPRSAAKDRIRSIEKAAKSLFVTLHSAPTDATVYADNLVNEHFSLQHLDAALLSLVGACTSVLARLDEPNQLGHHEGEYWNRWIRALTEILKDAKRPTGVSKAGNPSPFQRLVAKLQDYIPGQAQRHIGDMVTAGALAAAILRAQKGDGDTMGRG